MQQMKCSCVKHNCCHVVSGINNNYIANGDSCHVESATVDCNDFYHALNVDYTKVPSCTVKENVIMGYPLPDMPRRYYLKTLWTPNNETLNVWTHLAPALYFMWMLYDYDKVIDLQSEWPVLVTIIAALMVTTCSAIAHLFHSRSEFEHCCWLLLDFYGIIAYSFGSTVSHFFACTEVSYYSRLGFWNLAILTFNCCVVYYFLCLTKVPHSPAATTFGSVIRISGLAYGYVYGMLPILYRFMRCDWNSSVMNFHTISFIFMVISPCAYACNKPQCYKPGMFDIVGHNHQIFHVTTALMIYYDIIAVFNDVTMPGSHWTYLKQQPDHPSLYDVGLFAAFMTIWCASIGVYVAKTVHTTLYDKSNTQKCTCTYSDNCHKAYPKKQS